MSHVFHLLLCLLPRLDFGRQPVGGVNRSNVAASRVRDGPVCPTRDGHVVFIRSDRIVCIISGDRVTAK